MKHSQPKRTDAGAARPFRPAPLGLLVLGTWFLAPSDLSGPDRESLAEPFDLHHARVMAPKLDDAWSSAPVAPTPGWPRPPEGDAAAPARDRLMEQAPSAGETMAAAETRLSSSKGCVDAARDALERYRLRSKDFAHEDEAIVEPIGDLDLDGHHDIALHFPGSCGAHVGCVPYYLYLRKGLDASARPREMVSGATGSVKCDRFVGAYDGAEPELLAQRRHKLHDLMVLLPGLYGEVQTRLSFDGVRYLKVAERERTREEVGRPWTRWSKWTTFNPGVSAEDD